MFERYGTNSTAPTANCFCVPEYWTQLSELSSERTLLAGRHC